jgi:hypothetical protein
MSYDQKKRQEYIIGRGVVPPPKVAGHVKLVLEVVPIKFSAPLSFNLH